MEDSQNAEIALACHQTLLNFFGSTKNEPKDIHPFHNYLLSFKFFQHLQRGCPYHNSILNLIEPVCTSPQLKRIRAARDGWGSAGNTDFKLLCCLREGDVRQISHEKVFHTLQNEQCKLTTLYLRESLIGAAGATALADALQHKHSKLTTLDLEYNRIGVEGVTALAEALINEHCQLTTFYLKNNRIDVEEVTALAEALQHKHCKLTTLVLGCNQIGNAGAIALAAALQHDLCKLTSLNLSGNHISYTGATALARAAVWAEMDGRPVIITGIVFSSSIGDKLNQLKNQVRGEVTRMWQNR